MRPSRLPFDGDTSDDTSGEETTILSLRGRSRNSQNHSRSSQNQTGSPSRSSTRLTTTPSTTPRRRPGPASRTNIDSADAGPSQRARPPSNTASARQSQPAPAPRKRKNPPKPRIAPVLKQICRLQMSTKLLIPRLPFCRLVKEILHQHLAEGRMQPAAIEALQESAEIYVTLFLEDAYRCTLHRGQVTLQVKDLTLVRTLRKTEL